MGFRWELSKTYKELMLARETKKGKNNYKKKKILFARTAEARGSQKVSDFFSVLFVQLSASTRCPFHHRFGEGCPIADLNNLSLFQLQDF